MFEYLQKNKYNLELAKYMIPILYEYPKMDFDSVLSSLNFKKIREEDILTLIPFLKNKFFQIAKVKKPENEKNWIMGELRKKAIGNIALSTLAKHI
jgi:glutamyl-tRNA(Gln) amidotransferase subunit E